MPYVGQKPADIIATAVDTTTGKFSGVVDADAGITVDNITIDGTEIDLSSGDLTVDVAGDIILDADGGDIKLKDGSTIFGELTNNSSADGNFDIKCPVSDADIRFKGNDGGATITALRLDMSSAGSATFNHDIKLPDNGIAYFGAGFDLAISSNGTHGTIAAPNGILTVDTGSTIILDSAVGDIQLKEAGNNFMTLSQTSSTIASINIPTSDGDLHIIGNDGGVAVTAMSFDMSDAGTAVFNNKVGIGTSSLDCLLTVSGDTNPLARFTHTQNADEIIMIMQHAGAIASGFTTMIQFRNNLGAEKGTIKTNGTSTTFNTSSDYRLKENVSYDFDATTRLKQLKPARFNFIEVADNTVDGFLAHEVSSIVPEAITGDKDATKDEPNVVLNSDGTVYSQGVLEADWEKGKLSTTDKDGNTVDPIYASNTTWVASKTVPDYQGIDQSKLVPLLTKALQEQQATIEALTARIVTLENA